MAITVKSLSELDVTDSVVVSDLFHLGQGTADKSASQSLLLRLISDNIYPVGIVEQWADGTDPNAIFPGQQWRRLTEGAGCTIRIANETGTDIKQVDGVDKLQLTEANLPPHAHAINQTSSLKGLEYIATSFAGNHTHGAQLNYNGDHQHQDGVDAPGAQWGNAGKGTNNSGTYSLSWTSVNGGHNHAVGINNAGQHSHAFKPGEHSHLVSGNTYSTGNNWEVSTQNAYIKLAHWLREK